MRIIKNILPLRKTIHGLKKKGKTIGFVPTMGYFHEGHLSLMRRARRENDVVIVSLFVNPTQFGPREDFSRYPRDVKRDCRLARTEKVDYIFYPSRPHMYPAPFLSTVGVTSITELLCGASRPGHFNGVTTVVCKLFNIVQPDIAYFGQKDYQQYLTVKHMVNDLNMPVKLKLCPIVREEDGLAMSSRNMYLRPHERKRALSLYESLRIAERLIHNGERSPQKVIAAIKKTLEENVDKIDYIAILKASTFEYVDTIRGKIFIGVAAFLGATRLIDNSMVTVKK